MGEVVAEVLEVVGSLGLVAGLARIYQEPSTSATFAAPVCEATT